ncbi:MAG: holo-ACP synthase [Gammaproteobacteria bacterium]|nr:holo-ACP synthase [Gammaproteobacteria bacterium]
MIFGIGTDIVQVVRLQQGLDRFGERFAARILSDNELIEFRDHARPANFLARRFAAKEAAAKAMGTGFRDGLSLRQISVAHDANGKPIVEFSGRALEFVAARKIQAVHLSISDESDYAVAFVIFETARV